MAHARFVLPIDFANFFSLLLTLLTITLQTNVPIQVVFTMSTIKQINLIVAHMHVSHMDCQVSL